MCDKSVTVSREVAQLSALTGLRSIMEVSLSSLLIAHLFLALINGLGPPANCFWFLGNRGLFVRSLGHDFPSV